MSERNDSDEQQSQAGEAAVDPAVLARADQERTAAAADAGEAVAQQTIFLFSLAGLRLAVPADAVRSVSALRPVTRVPGCPAHVLGVVSYGERAIPVVDLLRLLQMEPKGTVEDDLYRRILVLVADDLEVGVLCDRAHGIMELPAEALRPPNALQGTALRRFLSAEVDEGTEVVGLLRLDTLLETARVS